MRVKMNRNAAKELKKMLESEGAEEKMLRVYVTERHGGHAHYALVFDTPNEHDEVVETDKGIDLLLDSREEFLDGIWIQYFYVGQEGFVITNHFMDTDSHH